MFETKTVVIYLVRKFKWREGGEGAWWEQYFSFNFWFELEHSTKIFDFIFRPINLSNCWVHHYFNLFGFFPNWLHV